MHVHNPEIQNALVYTAAIIYRLMPDEDKNFEFLVAL